MQPKPRLRWLATVLVATLLNASFPQVAPLAKAQAPTTIDIHTQQFLPIAQNATLVGVYDCLEYEFGLVWSSDVVTLYSNGTSRYEYGPPYANVVTGTWVYKPTAQEVRFTGFRWITPTVQLPDRFFASRYLPEPGFEIAVSCLRRATPLNDRRMP